ncbi:MAG: methyltransferase [Methanothrix sp.]|nr:methyltransferase [Methanothrix sp.]
MDCPACGKDCVKPAIEVLASLDKMYLSCFECKPEPNLDKEAPLKDLPREIERCSACGRAPLDAVMLDALRVLEEFGLRDGRDNLRSVGSPLIAVGCPLPYSPRLGPGGLIIVGERLDKDAAEAMVKSIPEIKGVILSKGVPGVRSMHSRPIENVLLAGCDLRADVVSSIFGELVIYKSQSKIHIEFPKMSAPKMKILEELYFQGKISDVVDGLCGPGTLGLMCALAGAQRVVLNDAWLAAAKNAMLNLEVNKELLGIKEIEHLEYPSAAVGRDPVLIGHAHGQCEIEVYHGNLTKLFTQVRPASLCLIDHFPGEDTEALEKACSCCKNVIII